MNKKDLLNKLKEVEGLTKDEETYLVNLVITKKKYGLVWEDKPEDVEKKLCTYLAVLKEVKEQITLKYLTKMKTAITVASLVNTF
jgi:adenine-specific DNA-methyltransferase